MFRALFLSSYNTSIIYNNNTSTIHSTNYCDDSINIQYFDSNRIIKKSHGNRMFGFRICQTFKYLDVIPRVH